MNGEKRFREFTIDKRAIDEESRTIELAFTVQTPNEESFVRRLATGICTVRNNNPKAFKWWSELV
jgi:hypothetical protein